MQDNVACVAMLMVFTELIRMKKNIKCKSCLVNDPNICQSYVSWQTIIIAEVCVQQYLKKYISVKFIYDIFRSEAFVFIKQF